MAKGKSVPSLEIPGCMCYRDGWLESLQRSAGYQHSGEVYAFHCIGCGNSWKIYQQSYHGENCPRLEKTPFDLELAKKLVQDRKRAVYAYWRNFDKLHRNNKAAK